jgi:dephospho-CoA kinase
MVILGLTGSIGMGKSAAARAFKRLGVPVHEADRAVHALVGRAGEAVPLIEAAFEGVVAAGAVDRPRLARRVFGDADALARLEAILHPMVERRERAFLAWAARRRVRLVVLEIPLLFETGAERRCDWVATVSAPAFLQRRRVLARAGMTPERLAFILARQTRDAVKRLHSDFVIPSGLDRGFGLRAVKRIVRVAAGIGHPRRTFGRRRRRGGSAAS